MPIFEYKCEKCEVVAEFLESSAGKKKHKCEKCGEDMKKQFSSFSGRMGKSSASCAKNPGCPQAGCCPNAM